MQYKINSDELKHYGVLGMKWGVRNAETRAKYASRGERRAAKKEYKGKVNAAHIAYTKRGAPYGRLGDYQLKQDVGRAKAEYYTKTGASPKKQMKLDKQYTFIQDARNTEKGKALSKQVDIARKEYTKAAHRAAKYDASDGFNIEDPLGSGNWRKLSSSERTEQNSLWKKKEAANTKYSKALEAEQRYLNEYVSEKMISKYGEERVSNFNRNEKIKNNIALGAIMTGTLAVMSAPITVPLAAMVLKK